MCGLVTTRLFSPFVFSGRDKVDIVCPNPMCDSECLTIQDRKSIYEMDVDCPVCGDLHNYRFRRSEIWQRELTEVSCRETGIGVCFIGDKQSVQKALRKAQQDFAEHDAEQADFYEDYIPPDGDEGKGEKISLASDILHAMEEEKVLSCRCGSRSVSITLIDGALVLRCKRCGSMKKLIPTNEFLRSLASSDSYIFNN